MPRKTHDALGQPLVADAMYFVQDTRTIVGNCVVWWRPSGNGYACDLDDAGKYSGDEVATMRDTDVPWPVEEVLTCVVRHVRIEPLRRKAGGR